MGGCRGAKELFNSFALVSYFSGPLLKFLDGLRCELVHECEGNAHLTVLPPRPLVCSPDEAWKELKSRLSEFQPFRVELADVEVFPTTQVIYLGLKSGNAELARLHQTLNAGRCQFQEPFPFHPLWRGIFRTIKCPPQPNSRLADGASLNSRATS